jgi:hypothetical protein
VLRSFTERYSDESTKDQFIFVFYCDICENHWRSIPVPFSLKGDRSIWKTVLGISYFLWRDEHKDAFERANREGMFHFNRCSLCNRWVCDDHFSEDVGLCLECMSKGVG